MSKDCLSAGQGFTGQGLTTTKAPYIEKAVQNGEIYIEQPYELYSEENHLVWKELYARIKPRWEKYAHPKFLEGVESLAFPADRVPKLSDINKFLFALSRFKSIAVSGFIPGYTFFNCLAEREFPTTITIRDRKKLNYLQEPDIFHDIAGHVPMHTDPQFADVLVRFGRFAKLATDYASGIKDSKVQVDTLRSIIRALGRFFWFTIEFGLMKRPQGKDLCVYGSGILSSFGELEHSLTSPLVQRMPLKLEWVINQYFEIDSYQPLLFYVDSFDHLFQAIDRLEEMLLAGELDRVAYGLPDVSEEDLKSFLEAAVVPWRKE